MSPAVRGGERAELRPAQELLQLECGEERLVRVGDGRVVSFSFALRYRDSRERRGRVERVAEYLLLSCGAGFLVAREMDVETRLLRGGVSFLRVRGPRLRNLSMPSQLTTKKKK